MQWLQRRAWWGLLAMAASAVILGLVGVANGVTWQAEDATGKTIAQIAAESSAGSRLSDFSVRTDGLHLIALGLLAGAVLVFGFRQDRVWAWWTMWILVVHDDRRLRPGRGFRCRRAGNLGDDRGRAGGGHHADQRTPLLQAGRSG